MLQRSCRNTDTEISAGDRARKVAGKKPKRDGRNLKLQPLSNSIDFAGSERRGGHVPLAADSAEDMVSIGSGKIEQQQADLNEDSSVKDQFYATNESFGKEPSASLQKAGGAAMRETDAGRITEVAPSAGSIKYPIGNGGYRTFRGAQ